jgi:hypothetical protein
MKSFRFRSALRQAIMYTTIVFSVVASARADEVLYEHPFPTPLEPWCTSCFGSFRVWDVFDLASNSAVTQIDARVYLDSGTFSAPLEFSVWDTTRSVQYFSQSFAAEDLSITPLGHPAFDISAGMTGLNLPAGSYALSLYYFVPSEQFAWYSTNVTVHGRSVQTFDAAGTIISGGGNARDMAFRIIGERVPEPSAGLLAAIAVSAVGLRTNRRRSSTHWRSGFSFKSH